jgi:hypothetical protein
MLSLRKGNIMYHLSFRLILWLALAPALAFTALAAELGVSQQQAIVRNVLKAKTTARDSRFQRWAYTTAMFHLVECVTRGKSLNLEKELNKLSVPKNDIKEIIEFKPQVTGSYTSLQGKALTSTCEMLAEEGVNPACVMGTVITERRNPGKYPVDYIVLKPNTESVVNLTLKCAVTQKIIRSSLGAIQSTQSISSQFYLLRKDDINNISGSGFTKWGWNQNNELLIQTKDTGSINDGIEVFTNLQKAPFTWRLVIESKN